MLDPMVAFAHWRWDAPYIAGPPQFAGRAKVIPVPNQTGLVATRRGGVAHLDNGVAAITSRSGSIRYGARFLCGRGSCDVTLLPDASTHDLCPVCEDIAAGPCVYRCYSASGALLYIGSTGCRLRRLKYHEGQASWWPEVADVKVTRYPTIFEARGAERRAILADNPACNLLPRRGAALDAKCGPGA